jgi:hypothetical protein
MEKNLIKSSVNKILYEPLGQSIICAIFGLALALLFHRVCKGDCTTYYAPNIDEIVNKTFKLENTCYKYTPYNVKCESNATILEPYNVNNKPDNIIKNKNFIDNIIN